uniref:Secreted protein n=1 Tax=Triticum urartu TaxID=4572 RepID=A0A8R7UIP2_TRIUA
MLFFFAVSHVLCAALVCLSQGTSCSVAGKSNSLLSSPLGENTCPLCMLSPALSRAFIPFPVVP